VSKLFLDGLNQDFDLRHQLIFSRSEWSSLDDIISSITEEETRLGNPKVDDQMGFDATTALSQQKGRAFNQGKKKLFCEKCKRDGHTIDRCFKIHGYPPGWKRERYQSGGAHGGKWSQANYTKPEGELPMVDAQALEEYKSKLKLNEGPPSTQGYSSADSSFHATSQGMKPHVPITPTKSWIIDSGATNHMIGTSNLFTSYTPCSGKDRVRVADGSTVPITGHRSIKCTNTLSLSSVLHVPNFPVNMLSVSSITEVLNCRGWFDPTHCAFQDLRLGRILGTGTVRNGLYYLDEGSDEIALAIKLSPCQELLLLHRRLGHPSFAAMSCIYPSLFNSCSKEFLICDACEFAKHTRVPYPSIGLRSKEPFDIIHSDVWGPCEVHSISGHR
jgi:hypothetical protein